MDVMLGMTIVSCRDSSNEEENTMKAVTRMDDTYDITMWTTHQTMIFNDKRKR